MVQEIIKSFHFDKINDNELRKFSCWGSVEVKDRHGEIIPAEEVYKVMDIWMDRGAPIMFNHTNRQIGKGLNWQPLEKNGKPGVLITATIYKHYKEDDEVWTDIKKGKFEGLSIGGKSYNRETTEEGTFLRGLIGYEFSVVERCGNQEATFNDINMMAKSEKMVKEIKKEDPVVVTEQPEAQVDEFKTTVMDFINKVNERLDMIEEKISGGASEETAVESTKEETEEPKEEEKMEETEEEKSEEEPKEEDKVAKELKEIKKQLFDLKKSQVKEVVKSERPNIVSTQPRDLYKSLNNKVEEMAKSGKIDFASVGAEIRKAQEEELRRKFN